MYVGTYSIFCFTILHTAISLSYRCLGNIWRLSQIVDNLHVDRYWVLYQVPVCDMGYFSITVWGGNSTFLDGYLGSNLQMWKCNDFMDCFTSYNILKTLFFLLWKKKMINVYHSAFKTSDAGLCCWFIDMVWWSFYILDISHSSHD